MNRALAMMAVLSYGFASTALAQAPREWNRNVRGRCYAVAFTGGAQDSTRLAASRGPIESHLPAAVSFAADTAVRVRWLPIATGDARALWKIGQGDASVWRRRGDTTRIISNVLPPQGWDIYLVARGLRDEWLGTEWVGSDYVVPIHYSVAATPISCEAFNSAFILLRQGAEGRPRGPGIER